MTEEAMEPTINVEGVPVPLSMAAAAVSRCIRAIQIADHLIQQGFASKEELQALRAGLTGENVEENVANADGTIQ